MNQSFFKKSLATTVGGLAIFGIVGCQGVADKMIDDYFKRKGVEVVEKTIDEIVKKKREEARRQEEPNLQERLKNRVNVSITGAPVKGPENAAITIVEFSDFECPFCKRVLPSVDQLMKEYQGKVKLAFRHNPLPFHPKAMPAAKAAYAAHKQGKFWEMYDLLFSNQQALSEENFKKWAKDLKLDVKKFEKDMKDPAAQKSIEEDSNFARANGAGGTPSFFINGVLLVGAQPFEKFKEIIDAVLAEKK
jgi:protein-disulfide isomerase